MIAPEGPIGIMTMVTTMEQEILTFMTGTGRILIPEDQGVLGARAMVFSHFEGSEVPGEPILSGGTKQL